MAGTTEVLTFRADLSDLRSELAKLPGITDTEAKGMVKSLERQLKKTERAAKKTSKATSASFSDMTGQVDKLGSAMSEFSPTAGGMVSGLANVGETAGALANPLGVIIAAATAITVAIGATVVGIAALTVGMVKATLASDDLLDELEKFGDFDGVLPPLAQSEIDAIKRANAAIEALGSLADVAVTRLGSDFAPTLVDVATRALAAGLAVLDFVDQVDNLTESVLDSADQVLKFIEALGVVADLLTVVPGGGALAVALDAAALSATGLRKGIGALRDVSDPFMDDANRMISVVLEFGDSADAAGAGVGSMMTELEASRAIFAMYVGTLSGVEGEVRRLIFAYSEQLEKLEKLAEISDDLALIEGTRLSLKNELETAIAELYAAEADAAQTTGEIVRAEKKKTAALDEQVAAEQRARIQANVEAAITSSAQISGSLSTVFGLAADNMAEAGRDSAIRMYRMQQAAALTQIAIDTAASVSRAFGTMGPGATFAVPGLIAVGAAQAAVVAATPPPQIAHTGAIVGSGLGPDERMVRARVGEGILSAAGVRAMGGAGAVTAANAGRGVGSAPIIVNQVYRGRVLDVAIQDQLSRSSALRRATAASRPRGRRNFYNGAL